MKKNLRKRLQTRLRPAQYQRVDIVLPFVGIDHFEVHDVANDVKFIRDAVAAIHDAAVGAQGVVCLEGHKG